MLIQDWHMKMSGIRLCIVAAVRSTLTACPPRPCRSVED